MSGTLTRRPRWRRPPRRPPGDAVRPTGGPPPPPHPRPPPARVPGFPAPRGARAAGARCRAVALPEPVEQRPRLLPDDPPRRRTLAGSALDDEWMSHVDPTEGLLLSAQGLLMYFQPDEVHRLIARCAERFPG